MLLISACSTTGGSDTSTGSSAFNGGDRALTFEFAQGAPPKKVRDGGLQAFTVRLLLENVGEYDIPQGDGHVSLSGFSPQDLKLRRCFSRYACNERS